MHDLVVTAVQERVGLGRRHPIPAHSTSDRATLQTRWHFHSEMILSASSVNGVRREASYGGHVWGCEHFSTQGTASHASLAMPVAHVCVDAALANRHVSVSREDAHA